MIYPFSAKMKKFIGGKFPCFIASVFSYLLFSFTKNYLLILPIQLFHLIGNASFWSAVVEYSKEVVPGILQQQFLILLFLYITHLPLLFQILFAVFFSNTSVAD